MNDLVGRELGRYHILEQLGEGGMATVYKAYDTRLEADVAVKVIRTESLPQGGMELALKRFEREAKALAKLTHPNIVPILDYGEYENSPYLVMKYLPGGTLKQYLNGKPIPWQEAVHLLLPVARALDYAHRQNMIHRDVKPSNILITSDGEPMLTDFGIAKIISEEHTLDLTGTSVTMGTPEYMAPEQVISKTVDHRADIYAFGVVFYEMVTGRRPFQADTPIAVLFKHASEPLPRPKQFVPSLPDAVEKVLLKALAKDPNDRYQTMGEFSAAMESLLAGKVARPVETPTIVPQKAQPALKTQMAVRQETPAPPPREIDQGTKKQKSIAITTPQAEQASFDQIKPPAKRRRWIGWAIGAGIACIFIIVGVVVGIPYLSKPATPTGFSIPTVTKSLPATPTQLPTLVPTPTTLPSPVTITIWHQWSDGDVRAIAKIFQEYSSSHPGVTISLSKSTDVTTSLKTAIPAGNGPDIVSWANDQIGINAQAGTIVALDDYGITQDFLRSTYEPASVAGVTWQDRIWALPEAQENITLIYNKAIASPADFPSDPMNFQDLLTRAEMYYASHKTADGRNIPLFCNQGFPGGDAYHIAPIFFGFGVPQYMDDRGKVYMNTPEAIAAGNWLLQIKPYLLSAGSFDVCSTAFAEGKVAAWWTGPWAIASIDKMGIQYGFIPMGRPFVSIKTLMLTKSAVDRGNAAIALDIMKYVTSYEMEKYVSLTNKTIPSNSETLKDPDVQALNTIAGFSANANLSVPMSNTPYANAQWNPIGNAITAIWTGRQTPAAALAAAQKAIETAIAGMK